MQSYSHHSARARTYRHANGAHVAEFTGFFNGAAWQSLARRVALERAPGLIGIDLAYPVVNDPTDLLEDVDFSFMCGSAPGVWVVRPDQYQACLHIARRLADMGITRTVFLQAFEPLALEFAARQHVESCQ